MIHVQCQGLTPDSLNKYGDTPAGRAAIGKQDAATKFLPARGGKEVRGSEEQRDRAIQESVRRQSERLEKAVR